MQHLFLAGDPVKYNAEVTPRPFYLMGFFKKKKQQNNNLVYCSKIS